MRAIVQDSYGESDVLRLEEVEPPAPKRGTVLIRVKSAGVNMADWHLMTGRPSIARLALGFRAPRARVRGEDVAGVVEAVGEGVSDFSVGDEVLGGASGSFADLAVAAVTMVARKPAALTWNDAGALPLAGVTALVAVRRARPEPGQHVLVSGAGGGVGSFVVQLAVAAGAEVTAVCSTGKVEFVRSLGATQVIDYTTTDVSAVGREVDAVIDFAGNRGLRHWRSILSPAGRVVLGGGEQGGGMFGGLERDLTARLATLGSKQSAGNMLALTRTAEVEEIAALVADGTIRVPVAREYALEEAPQAIDDLRAAIHPGKLVVRVS
jgi:NADPH:quinone reductase-like Zn-dependent oxidoreductase